MEDLNCIDCLYRKRKKEGYKNRCRQKVCRYQKIKDEAIAKGNITRPAGFFSASHFIYDRGIEQNA